MAIIGSSVTFGAPIAVLANEDRQAFLQRARAAVMALGSIAARHPRRFRAGA